MSKPSIDDTDTTASKAYKEPHIYDTIEEPTLIRELIVNDIYLLGGQFAILCQFAHPALAKGSFSHSSFATRIANRLKNTARFLNVVVFGTPEEKAAILSVIHGYHAHVKGDGYDANDPELQKWTAATLFVSLLVVHDTMFGKLPDDKVEALFKQCAVFGTSLRMPPEMWPTTLYDFWIYWDHNIATLEVTDMARKLCRDLLYPINLPLRLRLTTPLARILTVHFLPERLAKEYGLEPTIFSKLQFQAAVRTIQFTYPLLPQSARQATHKHYMEDLKIAVARIEKTGHWVDTAKL